MIVVKDKKDCCGCQACVERCPRQCISLKEDNEGFLYPKVNVLQCIDCHLCENVCPVINQDTPRTPLVAYAAKNTDDRIRTKSSSGGVFSILAESTINQGGVVFGARWDNDWHLIHDYTETINGLVPFRGSKYVQSDLRGAFAKAEDFLKKGRLVLFSGTPCQIAGIRKFLHKEYDNLLLIDIICHGVPSPGIFRQYLEEDIDIIETIENTEAYPMSLIGINFRDKRNGWKNYRFVLQMKTIATDGSDRCEDSIITCPRSASNTLAGKRFTRWGDLPKVHVTKTIDSSDYSNGSGINTFMKGFLSHLFLRPSCHHCPARELRSGSDITLGDFWGINHVVEGIDDDKGISAVIVNTLKGKDALRSPSIKSIKLWEANYSDIVNYNSSIVNSPAVNSKRTAFFTHNDWSVHQRVLVLTQLPFMLRTKLFCARIIRKIINSVEA